MPAILTPLVMRAIGIAAALALLAGALGYVHHLRARVATLTADNATLTLQKETAIRTAADNAARAQEIAAESARALDAVQAAHVVEMKRLASTRAITQEIASAPKQDARTLGPTALRALDRLRQRQAGGPPAGREDPADNAPGRAP
jgi:hypothetical protein